MKSEGVLFPRSFCGAMPAEVRAENRTGKRIYAKSVQVEDFLIEVMIDTGGLYLMLEPDIADALRDRLDRSHKEKTERINLRNVSVEGDIFWLPVTFLAEEGEDLVIGDLAVFLPTESSGWPQDTPNILGLEGALARMYFAFDQVVMPNGRFYFGFEEE